MADLMAEYIDASTFKLTGDLTSEFSLYRRVKADCGTDGYKYSCVGTSSYDSGTNKTTIVLLEAVLTANLVKVWFGVVGMGSLGAFPETGTFKRVLPQDLQLIRDGGMERGKKSISLNTGHYTGWTGATSDYSITIGYMAYAYPYTGYHGGIAAGKYAGANDSGVAIGCYANARHQSVSIGDNAGYARDPFSVSIGGQADAEYKGVCVGVKAGGAEKTVGIGYLAGGGIYSVAVGCKANCYYPGCGVTVGYCAYSKGGISIGYKARSETRYTTCLAGAICTRKTASASGKDIFLDYSAAEVTIMSGVVDLTAAGDTEISLPTGARFYPNEVGIVITEADSVTGQPSLSFGEGSASPATLSASAQTTGLDVVGDRERRQTLNKDVGVTVLSATVDTAATATTLTGRVYFQGLFVEDE